MGLNGDGQLAAARAAAMDSVAIYLNLFDAQQGASLALTKAAAAAAAELDDVGVHLAYGVLGVACAWLIREYAREARLAPTAVLAHVTSVMRDGDW